MFKFNIFKTKFKNPKFDRYYPINFIKAVFMFLKSLLWKKKLKNNIKKIGSIEELAVITSISRPGALTIKKEDSKESPL